MQGRVLAEGTGQGYEIVPTYLTPQFAIRVVQGGKQAIQVTCTWMASQCTVQIQSATMRSTLSCANTTEVLGREDTSQQGDLLASAFKSSYHH